MSYLLFYCENIDNNDIRNNEVITGKCYDMCPQDEVTLREKEKLVHVLEVVGEKRKLVKSYSRSAADTNMAVPRLLRPYPVLKDTVQYLLLNVTKRDDIPTQVVYDFINDRLKAVRQDMIIQRLPPEECVILLEPMIRFHVFYGYKLCELSLNDYDPVLNKKYLLECIKWCLSCFDSMDKQQNGDKMDDLARSMSQMKVDNRYNLKCDRILMETLYIMCNLYDADPLFRFLSLSKDLKCHATLQLAYKIAIANIKGNFIKVCKLLEMLPPLMYCALYLHLPVLQRQALKVMSRAYNSEQLTVPCNVLRRWLHFSSDSEVMEVCKHYGLKTKSGGVMFVNRDFEIDAPLLQPKKNLSHMEKLNLSIGAIFTTIL